MSSFANLLPVILLLVASALASVAVADDDIRQCCCAEQSMCLDEIRQNTRQCVTECREKADLKEFINDQSKLKPCEALKLEMGNKILDCVKTNLADNHVCWPNTSGPAIPMINSAHVIASEWQAVEEDLHDFMKSAFIGRMDESEVDVLTEAARCVSKCVFNRMENSKCFVEQKCTLKLETGMVDAAVKKCIASTNFHRSSTEVCECIDTAGMKNMTEVCEALKATKMTEVFGN